MEWEEYTKTECTNTDNQNRELCCRLERPWAERSGGKETVEIINTLDQLFRRHDLIKNERYTK